MITTCDYFELKIKINPEIAEILSDICFEYLNCEGVIQSEETYKNTVLVSSTEDTLKVYLKSADNIKLQSKPNLKSQSRLGLPTQQQEFYNALIANCSDILNQQRQNLLNRGFSEQDLGSWDFEIEKIENQDWSKKWKENWDTTHVSDKITIVPSWIEYSPKPDEITITLDPGNAFGTGTHPTTQLCMRALEKYFILPSPLGVGGKYSMDLCEDTSPLAGEGRISTRGTSVRNSGEGYKTLADIGTGSGILAICGAKLGAEKIYACDNDETVIETAIENARKNGVLDKCVFEHNTADKIKEKFDFITANILHNVLADIMGDLKKLMKEDAKLVLSGILEEKKQIVLDAVKKHNLKLIEEMHQDVWIALVVERY